MLGRKPVEPASSLPQRIEARTARIAVVGLGYVGMATVGELLARGHAVTAFERDANRRREIEKGPWPFPDDADELQRVVMGASTEGRFTVRDVDAAGSFDIWVLCTETPAPGGKFDDVPLRSALALVRQTLSAETLVIVQSTVPTGTMNNLVVPALESGSTTPTVVYAPVRVMPGKLLENTRTLHRVVGVSSGGAQAVRALFGEAETEIAFTDYATAELVKLTENAYRDAQIALANEVAGLCRQAGADFWRVRELVNMVPGRALAMPGPGVGGACLPKDTWLLLGDRHDDTRASILRAARVVNQSMPETLVSMLLAVLPVPPADAVIAVLGLTYRENCSVTRDSPAKAVVDLLRSGTSGVPVLHLHDPAAAPGSIAAVVAGADVVLVLVRHDAYTELDWAALAPTMRGRVVFDGCGALRPEQLSGTGLLLRGIGRP